MGSDVQIGPQPCPGPRHADAEFDRIARLVRRHLSVSTAGVALVGPDGVLLPGSYGMPESVQSSRLVPYNSTLTRHVITTNSPIILEDASVDPGVAAVCARYGAPNGAVIVMPVLDDHGFTIGTLFAIHDEPRSWSEDDVATLADLAASCSSEIQIRNERERARQAESVARRDHRRAQALLNMSEAFAGATTAQEVEAAICRVVLPAAGAKHAYLALVDPDRRGVTYVGEGPRSAPIDPRNPAVVRRRNPRRRISDHLPVSEVVRTGTALHLQAGPETERQFPLLAGAFTEGDSYSFLPVTSQGVVTAVVALHWEGRRVVDPDTATLGVMLTSYVGHALDRVALLEARREVATTLQAALLTEPPAVDGLEIATTYEPATRTDQVGGDWHDVVAVDDDTTMLMIGDVTGHDMQAAAWMGQLRSMLRALAWSHDASPSALLTLLDRANHELGPRTGATAVLARLERQRTASGTPTGTYTVTWSNAGHPPPMVLRQDGSVEVLDVRTDLLLGCQPRCARADHTTTLGPGETFLLYTDGLVEQRGSSLSQRLTVLAESLAHTGPGPTATLPAALVREMVMPPQRDDIAVLAVRAVDTRRPETVHAERRLAGSLADLGPTRRWIDTILESAGVGEPERRIAMLLSSETLTNALEHGEGPVTAMVEVDPATAHLRVSVRDASSEHPQLRDPEPHELSGRGVLFLDRLAARWGVVEHDGREVVGRHGQDVQGKTVWFELEGPES